MAHLILALTANPLSTVDQVAAKALSLAEKFGIDIDLTLDNGKVVSVKPEMQLSGLIETIRHKYEEDEHKN